MESLTSPLVRRSVRDLHAYRAGTTIEAARRKYGLDRIIKLSSNENPLGASPRALEALHHLDALHLYADDELPDLRDRLGARHGYARDSIICGHGSNDVLMTLFATFVDPGDEVVLAQPTFSLFPNYVALFGAKGIAVPLCEGVHDLAAMREAIGERTKLVVVVDPNNPTGTSVDPAAFARFVASLPDHVLLVVDQAYREFAPREALDAMRYVRERPNTIVTRTMSKVYGLASLRFGYAVASPEIVGYMQRVRTPFNVSRPAAVAVLAALDDEPFLERSLANNEEGKRFLGAAFARLGMRTYPTAANFHALAVPVEANRAYEDLMAHGVVVRSGDGLGLPNYLRITIGTPDENVLLVSALEAAAAQWRVSDAVLT